MDERKDRNENENNEQEPDIVVGFDKITGEGYEAEPEKPDSGEGGVEFVAHAAESDTPTKTYSAMKEIREWAFAIIIALVATMLIKLLIFDIVMVDGHSMDTTLADGERLVLMKLGYQPKQFDVIVLDANYKTREAYIERKKQMEDVSWFEEMQLRYGYFTQKRLGIAPKYYVKRVIGMPGDIVDINNETGEVSVNGTVLDEPYIHGAKTRSGNDFSYPYQVEEDCVFVMGDNRGNSSDSRVRSLGTVPIEAVQGKAVFKIWPLNKIGTIQ